MTRADLLLLSPWLLLGGGLVALLVLVGFWRRHTGIAALTTALLLATAALALALALRAFGDLEATQPLVALDGLALLMTAVFALAGAAVAVLARRYLEGRGRDPEEFYVLLACAVFGAATLGAASHMATLLLGLEILAISLYALIAYPEGGTRPLEAALKYLVLSGVASTSLLFGAALVYARTGSLGLDAPGGAGVVPADDPMLLVGTAMIFGAVAFKLSLVPFHLWTPDVYEGAPAPVSAFVSTVSKAAVVVVVLRIVIAADLLAGGALFAGLATLAMLSMLVGNLLALLQRSVKRLLAYSSVAHMGYLMIALLAVGTSAGGALAVEATVVYVIAYTVMTLAAFGVVATLSPASAERDVDDETALTGLYWRRPFAATVLTIALLSLAGIPLTAGFLGKFYVVAAGVERSLWPLLWMLLVGSGIGLFYYLRILQAMVRTPADTPAPFAEQGLEGGWVLGILAGTTLLLGTWPAWLVGLVQASLAS